MIKNKNKNFLIDKTKTVQKGKNNFAFKPVPLKLFIYN